MKLLKMERKYKKKVSAKIETDNLWECFELIDRWRGIPDVKGVQYVITVLKTG